MYLGDYVGYLKTSSGKVEFGVPRIRNFIGNFKSEGEYLWPKMTQQNCTFLINLLISAKS